jgi:hypothetical protein
MRRKQVERRLEEYFIEGIPSATTNPENGRVDAPNGNTSNSIKVSTARQHVPGDEANAPPWLMRRAQVGVALSKLTRDQETAVRRRWALWTELAEAYHYVNLAQCKIADANRTGETHLVGELKRIEGLAYRAARRADRKRRKVERSKAYLDGMDRLAVFMDGGREGGAL